MADTGSEMNGVVLVGSDGLQQTEIGDTNETSEQNEGTNGEDLLQLALDEASGGLSTNAITYSVPNELVDAVAQEAFQGAISGAETTDLNFENAAFVVSGDGINFESGNTQFQIQTDENNSNMSSVASLSAHESNAVTVTLVPANEASGAPLGSSQNPIRIIQQGNQYTPVQQLTTDQLQQIMQVVQQQQVAKSASEGGGSSVLYNPQTNTKIVYRVIYPSELHKSSSSTSTTSQGQQTIVQIGQDQLPKRQYKKRREEEEKIEGPELTKEEKEAKKKHRPRTRSGRVSKPPKHMTKDYKHIHVVDWDEDYDDSDGGYSDFKYSEDEEDKYDENAESDFVNEAGQVLIRPKNWRCNFCQKCYIGRGGLARHYRQNPSHGNVVDLPIEESDSSNLSKPSHNGFSYAGSISEDSNTQDSISGIPQMRQGPGRPRKKGQRGRPPLYEQTPERKRHKLKEFIKHYDTEDLMDIVLPRLAKVATLWEFLMMKVESSDTNKPNIQSVYHEVETLTEKVKELFKTCLKLSDNKPDGKTDRQVKMTNAKVADALGFECGTYDIDNSVLKSTRREILIFTDNIQLKRPISKNSIESPTKRFKSILPSNKNNVVVSTQGNIVLMGTHQTSSSPRVLMVNPSHSEGKALAIVNKNQSNSSASVLECVQTQQSSVVYGISPSQSKLLVNPSSSVRTQPPANHSSSNKTSSTKTVVLTNNVNVLPQKVTNSILKPQISAPVSKTTSILPPQKSTPTKSPGITIMSNGSSGFNSVGSISSVYNTSLLTNNHISKQTEVVTNNELVSVVSEGKPGPENGISNSQDATEIESPLYQIKQELVDPVEGTMLIVSNMNGVDQNDNSESNEANLNQTVENGSFVEQKPPVEEVIVQNNSVEPTEVVQIINNAEPSNEQIESTANVITASNIYQTPEGIIIIQNPDGSTVQLQGSDGEPIPIETVQALLEGQLIQATDGGIVFNQ